ncbi:MAG: hypothetical protein KJ067_24505 [Vicinamibacteria bacterium]|jgi:hypothetical protein|nr:hypothetical protein [Vicinamibacteria bacterium]
MATVALTIEFPLRVVVYPAPDLADQWIAHGLETDIVTQGDSAEHALGMMAEALETLAAHDALRNRSTMRLRPAPTEVWNLAATATPMALTAHVERQRKGHETPAAGPWRLYGLLSRKGPVGAGEV